MLRGDYSSIREKEPGRHAARREDRWIMSDRTLVSGCDLPKGLWGAWRSQATGVYMSDVTEDL